jgi:hypothetical protein
LWCASLPSDAVSRARVHFRGDVEPPNWSAARHATTTVRSLTATNPLTNPLLCTGPVSIRCGESLRSLAVSARGCRRNANTSRWTTLLARRAGGAHSPGRCCAGSISTGRRRTPGLCHHRLQALQPQQAHPRRRRRRWQRRHPLGSGALNQLRRCLTKRRRRSSRLRPQWRAHTMSQTQWGGR